MNSFSHDTLAFLSFNPQLSRLPCDAWHHHYHYQSSAQYLWLAETLAGLGLQDDAHRAYDKAIFQDHLNKEAIERRKNLHGSYTHYIPAYDGHPLSDAEFCREVGRAESTATKLHDEAAQNPAEALALLDKAIAADPVHSNSYFARGKYYFLKQDYTQARKDLEEAIGLSHGDHERYHRAASDEHLARARNFLSEGECDLAITSCTKALDLDKNNKQALKMRADAYRAKGSVRLAEDDESSLLKA